MSKILHGFVVVLLTLLTQLGGVAYLLALFVGKTKTGRIIAFAITYASLSIAALFVAPLLGRVPIDCLGTQTARMQSPLYCALNRQYVSEHAKTVIDALAASVDKEFPETTTLVLDANFPFIDGFPLLPHLSHDDGKKFDAAFYYQDENKVFQNAKTRSPIGYWAFEQPTDADDLPCNDRRDLMTLRWNFNWLQSMLPNFSIEPNRTQFALEWLAEKGTKLGVRKVLIEPHLKNRFLPSSDILRFQGCRAARHDDHFHVEITNEK